MCEAVLRVGRRIVHRAARFALLPQRRLDEVVDVGVRVVRGWADAALLADPRSRVLWVLFKTPAGPPEATISRV